MNFPKRLQTYIRISSRRNCSCSHTKSAATHPRKASAWFRAGGKPLFTFFTGFRTWWDLVNCRLSGNAFVVISSNTVITWLAPIRKHLYSLTDSLVNMATFSKYYWTSEIFETLCLLKINNINKKFDIFDWSLDTGIKEVSPQHTWVVDSVDVEACLIPVSRLYFVMWIKPWFYFENINIFFPLVLVLLTEKNLVAANWC